MERFAAALRYCRYLARHKWYVFVECAKHGLWWRGITHDLSKFYPSEFWPYVDHFCSNRRYPNVAGIKDGYMRPADDGDDGFEFAWHRHQRRNDHHWQWWISITGQGPTFRYTQERADPDILAKLKVFPMSEGARLEMLCDWRGAGKAQGHGDNTAEWYAKNKDKMILHPDTRKWIEDHL